MSTQCLLEGNRQCREVVSGETRTKKLGSKYVYGHFERMIDRMSDKST